MTSVRVFHFSEVSDPSYWDELTEEERIHERKVLKAAQTLRAAADAGFPVPPPPEGVKLSRETLVTRGWPPEAVDALELILTEALQESWALVTA